MTIQLLDPTNCVGYSLWISVDSNITTLLLNASLPVQQISSVGRFFMAGLNCYHVLPAPLQEVNIQINRAIRSVMAPS